MSSPVPDRDRPAKPIVLDEDDVSRHLDMAEVITLMRETLKEFSSGHLLQPVRGGFEINPPGGLFFWMPARAQGLGVKLVSFYPGNAATGMPTHMAMIFLADPMTGAPLAVMDGRLITEMRTAAVSAVATDLLAPPTASSLAILGSGVQARSHLLALRLVRPIDDVRVWSRNAGHAQAFAEEFGARALPAEEAVRGADLVVTATSATEPVLLGRWLKPGAHVNAVGACRPNWRELDTAAMQNRIYVDSRAAAEVESGDIILSKAKIHAEIGEALLGRASLGEGHTTLFKSLGMAVEDVALATQVYRRATGMMVNHV